MFENHVSAELPPEARVTFISQNVGFGEYVVSRNSRSKLRLRYDVLDSSGFFDRQETRRARHSTLNGLKTLTVVANGTEKIEFFMPRCREDFFALATFAAGDAWAKRIAVSIKQIPDNVCPPAVP